MQVLLSYQTHRAGQAYSSAEPEKRMARAGRYTGLTGFSVYGERPSAESRNILKIRLILSNLFF